MRYNEMRVIKTDGTIEVVKDPYFDRYQKVKKTEYTRNKKEVLGGAPPQQRHQRKEAILNALNNCGMTVNELSQCTGITDKFVFEYLKELELAKKILRYKGRYYVDQIA